MKLSKAREKGIVAAIEKRALRAYDRCEGSRIERALAYVGSLPSSFATIGYALWAKHALWEERRVLYGYGDGKAPGKVIRA